MIYVSPGPLRANFNKAILVIDLPWSQNQFRPPGFSSRPGYQRAFLSSFEIRFDSSMTLDMSLQDLDKCLSLFPVVVIYGPKYLFWGQISLWSKGCKKVLLRSESGVKSKYLCCTSLCASRVLHDTHSILITKMKGSLHVTWYVVVGDSSTFRVECIALIRFKDHSNTDVHKFRVKLHSGHGHLDVSHVVNELRKPNIVSLNGFSFRFGREAVYTFTFFLADKVVKDSLARIGPWLNVHPQFSSNKHSEECSHMKMVPLLRTFINILSIKSVPRQYRRYTLLQDSKSVSSSIGGRVSETGIPNFFCTIRGHLDVCLVIE
ncbi:hypothetical protein Tco_1304199 [Tanacetum coccineum]